MTAIDRNNELLEQLNKKQSLPYRFLAGLFAGLGATLGLTLVLTLVGYLIGQLQATPIIGGWISGIINEAISNTNIQSIY